MKRIIASLVVLLCFEAGDLRITAKEKTEWGSGVAPFAFALIGDMPYGTARETPFARLVAEINRDNDVDFVMHAGDIKAGSERCDDVSDPSSIRVVPNVPAPVCFHARGQRVDRLPPGEQRPVQPARATRLSCAPYSSRRSGRRRAGRRGPCGHRPRAAHTPSSSRT